MGLLIGCAFGIGVLFIVLLIASVILRAAVWITNKCLGAGAPAPSRRRRREDEYDDEDEDDDWDDRPARRPAGIPEPELFKGMGIAFVVFLCQFVVGFMIGLVMGVGAGAAGGFGGGGGGGGNNPFGPQPGVNPALQLASSCVSLVTGFLIWSGILTAMLPTTFGRAALVTVFIYLIGFAIGVVIVGALLVAGIGLAGLR